MKTWGKTGERARDGRQDSGRGSKKPEEKEKKILARKKRKTKPESSRGG